MSTQSDQDTVNQAMAELEFDLVAVPAAIATLLNVPPPKGDGAVVAQIADGFKKAASATDHIALQVAKAASQDLPEVWLGAAADLAGDVVVAVGEDLERGVEVFTRANTILSTLAAAFDDARKKHADAQDPLHRARAATDNADYGTARSLGFTGADLLLSAIDTVVDAGKNAARDLNTLADQARAHEMNSSNLSSSDKLVLAESAVPGGPHDLNLILSESDVQRAAQRFDQLSPADRQCMDELLAQAKSPQERAYLMKTLAAGHSLDEVANFDALIHNHGDDPGWLQQHLTPIVNTGAQHADIDYQGGSWTQGQYPTCVAASTVMARAMVDPSYTLQLTTGNRPDDPNSTSKEAFLQRLRNEQQSVYDHGRSEGDFGDQVRQLFGADGMYDDEGQKIANEDIGKYDGQDYQHHDVSGSADDRRKILPSVEHAVDQGKPVPIQVTGDDGHQMLIIGHQGNRLEIYNPWGTTNWVDEDDFINGHMDKIDPNLGKVPPDVSGVLLPR